LLQQAAEALDGRHVLADLGALEEMPAVQAGAENEVPLEQCLRADENIGDFLLNGVHGAKKWAILPVKGNPF
jgi:hypothetical protein